MGENEKDLENSILKKAYFKGDNFYCLALVRLEVKERRNEKSIDTVCTLNVPSCIEREFRTHNISSTKWGAGFGASLQAMQSRNLQTLFHNDCPPPQSQFTV